MKVLTAPNGSVLVFDPNGSASFTALDGTSYPKGIVSDVADVTVAQQMQATLRQVANAVKQAEATRSKDDLGIPFGTGGVFAFVERRDLLRDVQFIQSNVTDVAVGTEVGVLAKGRGLTLDIPQSARPNYQDGLKVGSQIAVGPNVTPKAFINARGTVIAINGVRATVEFDARDIDRVRRATGKNFPAQTKMHKSTLEVM